MAFNHLFHDGAPEGFLKELLDSEMVEMRCEGRDPKHGSNPVYLRIPKVTLQNASLLFKYTGPSRKKFNVNDLDLSEKEFLTVFGYPFLLYSSKFFWWIYTGDLEAPSLYPGTPNIPNYLAWRFGQLLGAPRFMNACFRAVFSSMESAANNQNDPNGIASIMSDKALHDCWNCSIFETNEKDFTDKAGKVSRICWKNKRMLMVNLLHQEMG